MRSTEDSLGPLRQVLRQPDRRTWRRFLPAARGAHRPNPAAPALAQPPGDPWIDDPPDVGPVTRRPRAWPVVAGVLTLAAGLVLGTGLLPVEPNGRDPGPTAFLPTPPDPAPAPAPAGVPPNSEPMGVRVWPVERVEVVDRVVRTDAGRWEVGVEGDVVTIGDWDCDRSPTPAVLRPADGRVAVFDRWAPEDRDEAARPVGTVPGATTLGPAGACGELVVRTASGTEHVVDTRTSSGEGAP